MSDRSDRKKFPLAQRKTAPLTYVLPPIAAALENAQAVAAIEIGMMRDRQTEPDERGVVQGLSADKAKALGSLVTAMIQAERAKRELANEGWEGLTDEQLEVELTKELESIRARRESK